MSILTYLLLYISFIQQYFTIVTATTTTTSNITSTTTSADNNVWDELLYRCSSSVSFDCVQDTLHKSLETTLDGDFSVTDSINFTKNANKYSLEANQRSSTTESDNDGTSTINSDEFEAFVNSVEHSEADLDGKRKPKLIMKPKSVVGISDILYNKGIHYLMTHNLNIKLPEFLFGGGNIRIEPKSFEEDGGALVKINFDEPAKSEGRIFFKKIKHLFKKRLMSSFMAAMLIIKLVKMKMIFLLPMVVGVTTAKKILLKVLLFLFPALAHLFKLCAYYHHQHSKYHLHHHHQVAHHHHHPSPTIYIPPPSHEYDYPPPGAEIVHRTDPTTNELSSWGIDYQGPINGEPDSISRLYSVNKKPGGSKLYRPSRYKLGRPHRRRKRPTRPRYRPPSYNHNSIPSSQGLPVQATAPLHLEDPFYSPILTKLDRVFLELGFTEETCKERLVCSMYKAPERFSPHSNLVSAEISRDPSELQKPLFANPAVIRFFRYVQAARNGQDMKDCLTLYPACSLLTE